MECRREYSRRLFQKKFSRNEEKNENHTLTFRKINKSETVYLNAQSENPTVIAENIARNTFQQTVRTDKNSRNDNNWSSLSKEDGLAKGKLYETVA